MDTSRYLKYIQDRISEASMKFDTKEERLQYEQGVLIGMLVLLTYYDSKNFDIIRKRLESLKKWICK